MHLLPWGIIINRQSSEMGSEVVQMLRRIILGVILPLFLISLWMITCYPVCKNADGFNAYLYWILAGAPFGVSKMRAYILPHGLGISGSLGVLAVNLLIGGLIGGFVLIMRCANITFLLLDIMSKGKIGKSKDGTL